MSRINSNYTVLVRRKRQNKTNYKKRLSYLKSGLTRLVVRPTSKNVLLSLVNYADEGDKVICSVDVSLLKKIGWKHHGGNFPSAYLLGLMVAKKKTDSVTDEVIVDFGLCHVAPKSRLFAAVKGAIDGGLNVIVDSESLPSEERIKGSAIESYAKTIDKKGYDKQFSKIIKNGTKPEHIVSDFESVKKKIMGA